MHNILACRVFYLLAAFRFLFFFLLFFWFGGFAQFSVLFLADSYNSCQNNLCELPSVTLSAVHRCIYALDRVYVYVNVMSLVYIQTYIHTYYNTIAFRIYFYARLLLGCAVFVLSLTLAIVWQLLRSHLNQLHYRANHRQVA